MFRTILAALALFSLALPSCKNTSPNPDGETSTAPGEDNGDMSKDKKAAKPSKEDIPAPADVAAPPKDAQKTEKGVFYKVLKEGPEGQPSPKGDDRVEVHYSGWTTDGKMFDSSIRRGKTTSFGLNRVIPGWTDGLQVMSVGDKTRFWIPEEMAYKGQKGAPAGMLVFDVELVSITPPPAVPKDVAKPPKSAKKTKGGVSYVMLKDKTEGKNPRSFDKVKVHYSGWTTDGKMFDSSVMRGRPAEFSLGSVIPGWTEGIPVMTVGDKTRFWIPEKMAYEGKPGRPKGMLVFDVELLSITEMPEPPKTPENVAKPPKKAKKTKSGVSYMVLSQKNKDANAPTPKPENRVKVHYSGWTTDGKMFDSSVTRGQPSTFGLKQVIKGWTDGLQVMHVGDKTRFWIPQDLAYKGQPGKPAGMLVFDVELLEIIDPNAKAAKDPHGH